MTFWKHSRCYQCPSGPWLATVIRKCSTIIFPVTTLLKSPFFNSGLIHRPSISGWIKSPLPSVPAMQKWKTERRWRAACSLQQPGMKTMVRSVQTHTHTHRQTHLCCPGPIFTTSTQRNASFDASQEVRAYNTILQWIIQHDLNHHLNRDQTQRSMSEPKQLKQLTPLSFLVLTLTLSLLTSTDSADSCFIEERLSLLLLW